MSNQPLAIEPTKKDFSKDLPMIVSTANDMIQSNGLDDTIQYLLSFEKKCRLANDFPTLKEVCIHIITLCKQQEDWKRLIAMLVVINKRRSQSKYAIMGIVNQAYPYIEMTPTLELKIELIETLMMVCEGKMYVEAENAKLHLMLALIYESTNMDKACSLIQDVHVETYGSLSKTEKAEYILEQIRLNLKNKDYIRALLQSRKMNRKLLEEKDFIDIKEKYYGMMIEYHLIEKNTWETSQCFHKIFEARMSRIAKEKALPQPPTEEHIHTQETQAMEALQGSIIYLILSKHDNQQSDMLHRTLQLKELQSEIYDIVHANRVAFKSFLTAFTTNEIISKHFPHRDIFTQHPTMRLFGDFDYFQGLLDKRIIEHNLRIISKCYTQIHLNRIALLLELPVSVVEDQLCEIANDSRDGVTTTGGVVARIHIKINRPLGIVSFQRPKSAEDVLSDWSSDISKLLGLMESTCHLIQRENMVHKI